MSRERTSGQTPWTSARSVCPRDDTLPEINGWFFKRRSGSDRNRPSGKGSAAIVDGLSFCGNGFGKSDEIDRRGA